MIAEPQIASLAEIEEYWSIDDVVDGNQALELREELRRMASEKGG